MIILTSLYNSMNGQFNHLTLKIKVRTNKLQETKKCPNCGYESLMECYIIIETKETYCKCPNCKFTFRKQKS